MPPVFGPVSPSPTRLWSCAAPSSSASRPVAQREQRDSPRRPGIPRSPPLAPASPNARASIIASIAASASASVAATTTPLPAARPSAFTTIGAPRRRTNSRAASASSNRSQRAVGMPAASQTSLANVLLPSSRAAAGGRAAAGDARPPPSHRRCPATSGASGPGTTRSTALSRAKATSAAISIDADRHDLGHRRDARIARRAPQLASAAGWRRSTSTARAPARPSPPPAPACAAPCFRPAPACSIGSRAWTKPPPWPPAPPTCRNTPSRKSPAR